MNLIPKIFKISMELELKSKLNSSWIYLLEEVQIVRHCPLGISRSKVGVVETAPESISC